jgi:molybdopterin-containing oxidoreductase family iron-sulfur binding subunit
MSRLYALESTPSLTGGMADHCLPLESERIAHFARLLAQRLGVTIDVAGSPDAQQARWLDALVADLQANRGASLIVIGPSQPPWLHGLGHVLNSALDNNGKTIDYSAPVQTSRRSPTTLSSEDNPGWFPAPSVASVVHWFFASPIQRASWGFSCA